MRLKFTLEKWNIYVSRSTKPLNKRKRYSPNLLSTTAKRTLPNKNICLLKLHKKTNPRDSLCSTSSPYFICHINQSINRTISLFLLEPHFTLHCWEPTALIEEAPG
ncbi:hypothetical protein V6Z12_D08G038300 [Gossypium hirsutum]